MSMSPDPEVGREPDEQVDNHRDDGREGPVKTSNQPLQGESNFGDSSGPLFSIYSKAAEDEDDKMVERWQKDAEGIFFFTGLFSASVAALLAVTVQDLRPNSQDTSAFYLGNIYQVLADPNITRSSLPSPVAKPPSFSPPRYAVWVNSLWFLSLVMSLSCALWATSSQQWARRYLRMAHPAKCNPENRARMRAFFAVGVDSMHIVSVGQGLSLLLHISLFLFFCGLAIFLFNVDREVFSYVTWWIVLFFLVYGTITVLPLIRPESPYRSPLSASVWFLYATTACIIATILCFVIDCLHSCFSPWGYHFFMSFRIRDFRGVYLYRMLRGLEWAAEKAVSERIPYIDLHILDWSITTLGDDDSLKNFFEAIPGFLNSKLVMHLEGALPEELRMKYNVALNGFMDRTWTSNSVNDSEKLRRLDVSMNVLSWIDNSSSMLYNILFERWDEVPHTLEMGQILARWCNSDNQSTASYAQTIICRILVSVPERDDRWITLAAQALGLKEQDLRKNIALGDDSILLAILIHITRRCLRSGPLHHLALEDLSKFDIQNTHPRLQHDFCTLWNEAVQEARKQGLHSIPVDILKHIRHHFIVLHQRTDAAPTAFSASTGDYDSILYYPLSYPLCNLASHRPDSIAQIPVPNSGQVPLFTQPASPPESDNTASQQAEQVNIVIEPPSPTDPMTMSEIGPTSHGPDVTPPTNPVHFSSRPFGASTTVVAASPQDVTSTATLSHPPEGSERQDSDMVAPSAEPGTCRVLSSASTNAPEPTLVPIPTSLPNTSSKSYDVGVTSVSNSSHYPPPSIGSSIPASRPTGSAALPRQRVRGLVNTRNICYVNAVLQLLVNLPPFCSLFRELGDLKGQRGLGAPGTGGSATPLADATVRFFNEFMVEEQPSMQHQSQPTGGTSRADEEKKGDNVVDSFEPTYIYDALKKKRRLRQLLDGQQQDAEEFLRLYLDALDEELPGLLASISGRESASAAPKVEEREVSQSGQTRVESQGFVANESPITRIFAGKFRSLVRRSNKPDVITTEDWRSLHLDILPDSVLTVPDALLRVSQLQTLQDGPSGPSNPDASQQTLIEALPPVLVLHLKRFRYDAAAGGVIKISKPVQFSPELEIPFDIMVPTVRQSAKPARYTLCGVLYHHGESAGGGHYTVDVLHPNGDDDTGEVWLHIDDETVSPVQHEDVFGEHADKRCAYLLFYCRTFLKDAS